MDNGLIFPYRRRTAHTEPGDAQRLVRATAPSGAPVRTGRDPIR